VATQNLIEQHVIFLSDQTFDIQAILNNTLIQTLANNSAGHDIIQTMQAYLQWDGTNWINKAFLDLRVFCTPAFQTTIQNNIPNLQAQLPQYTIVTWGYPVTFGN